MSMQSRYIAVDADNHSANYRVEKLESLFLPIGVVTSHLKSSSAPFLAFSSSPITFVSQAGVTIQTSSNHPLKSYLSTVR